MPFNIALTGLNAANQDLNVTANNLALCGFKNLHIIASGIEHGDIFENRAALDIVRVRKFLGSNPGSQQFSIGKSTDGLNPIAEVLPELGQIAGLRKTARHANNSNRGFSH